MCVGGDRRPPILISIKIVNITESTLSPHSRRHPLAESKAGMSAKRNSNRARCQHEGCEKFAQTRGLCKAHGGGSRCRDASCNKLAQSRGLCIAHGGGRRCQHEGCSKLAQSKGFCISHGGGRRCTVPNCEKFSQVKGRCKSHSKLAESSDHDDDEETDVEPMSEPMVERTTMASPPRRMFTHEYSMGSSALQHSPHQPGAYSGVDAGRVPTLGIDFLASSSARLQGHREIQDAGLRPPQSFPLRPSHPSQVALLPSRLPGTGVAPQPLQLQDEDMDENTCFRSSIAHVLDPSKRVPSINPRFHEEDDARPLSFVHCLPSSRPVFADMEEKRDVNDVHPLHPVLPSRFLPLHPPHFASHTVCDTHAEHPVEPTSISLLSFLDRTKDEQPHRQSTSATSASHENCTASFSRLTTTSTSSAATTSSPPLPSIVLPPLTRHHSNTQR